MTKAEQMIKEYKATHPQTETQIIYVKEEPNNVILITSLLTTAFFTFGLGFILGKVRR